MKLGEFREFTKDFSDDTDIIIRYLVNQGQGYVDKPMTNVRTENKDDIWLGDDYSDTVIYVEGEGEYD